MEQNASLWEVEFWLYLAKRFRDDQAVPGAVSPSPASKTNSIVRLLLLDRGVDLAILRRGVTRGMA